MSENSNPLPKCSYCGAALTPNAPQGLCPRCLMALNLGPQSEMTGNTGPAAAPPVRPPIAAAPSPAEIARHFPQLEIIECLGRGGMGVVYKARQPQLNRFVALKILAPEKEKDPAFAERFAREAKALARLNHPHIVTVYDFGKVDGLFYLLMEFVDGVSLRQVLKTNRLTPEQALSIVPKICEALQYAHEQGVVHRDIKPENVLMDKQGRVKIADFGIAKLVGDMGRNRPLTPSGEAKASNEAEVGEHLTLDQILGTPHYRAPEQTVNPRTVDHRADIYSLGVVFYEMLTGELPLGQFAPPSRKVQIDVRLDDVVLKALEKEPERRYQQASEVKTEVETITSGPQQTESASADEALNLAESRRRLRVPALGLAISSLSGPFMLGFLVEIGRLKAGAWMFWPLVIDLALTALAAYGALKALRLESYRSAVVGGIAGSVVSFLNFFCLPFAVWLLAVLTRPSVKRAFLLNLADDAGRKLSSPQQARRPHRPGTTAQAGAAFKRWILPVSGALLFLLILLGAYWGGVVLSRNPRFSAKQDPASDAQVLLDRSAAYRLPGDGPEEVADLSNRLLTEGDWEALKARLRLKRLDLQDSSITDADLERLAQFKELERLDLSATLGATPYKPRITGTGFTNFTGLVRLRSLILHGNPITDAGLEHLKSLPCLERLQLGATLITGPGLAGLTNLNWLRLDATLITDDGLRHLQTMSGLEQLYLDGTAISDTGLRYLADLKELRVLNLHGTKVTAAGVASLKKMLPAVAVGMDDELKNQLASAAEKRSAAERSAEFLPTREIVFGRRDLLQDCFLNLESGRLLSAPKELTDRLVVQNRWRPGQRVQPVPVLDILDWLRSNRVDLIARIGIDGLTLVDGMAILTAPRTPEVKAFDSVEATHVVQTSEMLAETLGFYTNQQPQGLAFNWFDPRGVEKTWIFRNREGRSGVLEILEPGGEAGRMKIRYKLASTVAAGAAERTAFEVQFGPVFERVLPFSAPCLMKYFQFHTGNVIAIGDGPGDTSDHAEEYRQAEATGGLDASAIGGKDGIQLVGRGCVFTRNRSPNWDNTTAEQTLQMLRYESWLNGVAEIGPKDFPATYLFKTARGECGMLQILGVTDDPIGWKKLGMKFRYKLVRSLELNRTNGSRAEVASRDASSLTPSRNSLSLSLDAGGETMQNIVGALREKHSVRVCLENLDFDLEHDAVTLERALTELEQAAKTRVLSVNETRRLSAARKLLADGSSKTLAFDVGERYHGPFQADSMEALLTQLTERTPYAWTKVESTFVIHPRTGSKLMYPVTLTTDGLTVEAAVKRILDLQPDGSKIGMAFTILMPVNEGVDPMPWCRAKTANLTLNRVSAMEALCRVTAGARPDSVWELAGYKGARMLGLNRGPVRPARTASGQASRGSVVLANGVACDVVGIARNPRFTNFWWKPDGTPFAEPPVTIEISSLPKLRGAGESMDGPENE